MNKHKNYTILNYKKSGEVVFNKQINTVMLVGIVTIVCFLIIITAFLFTYDSLKDEQYRRYEQQLKTEEKSLLKWRLNDEK